MVNSRREVLVVQERSGPLRGRGVWKMPTGLLAAGEDMQEGAARELMEETVRRGVTREAWHWDRGSGSVGGRRHGS